MAEGKTITPEDLAIINEIGEGLSINLRHVRQNAEISAINKALSLCDDNYTAAAKLLGITRPTLYDLINKYNLQ